MSLENQLHSTSPSAKIETDYITYLVNTFRNDTKARLVQNAVTQTTASDLALDRDIVTTIDFSFSTQLDQWTVTNQKRSGRCWMFAALNLLRVGAMEKMNCKSFEFSQNFTLFWDKFERSNYFLEEIIKTTTRDIDDRLVAFLLAQPLSDGGQWNMAIDIIRKHGLVPKSVMPETESSSNTRLMNSKLTERLRQCARDIRATHEQGIEVQRTLKKQALTDIWRILSIHLGTPPQEFLWQYQDKNHTFHREGMMTPHDFARTYITLPIDDYVCLVHDPRHPIGKTYTVRALGNVVGGDKVIYLNIDIDYMKDLTAQMLEGGTPVWFGCDVGKQMRRDLGLWDAKLFDYQNIYDVPFNMTKTDRLLHHQTLMTHAMLFTGVDRVDGKVRKWRVENSWGCENGRKGFYAMNDSWFDEYMFEIAAPKSLISKDLLVAFDQEPTVLPAWDPMGALAKEAL
jgi:bleomycin hydrolase